MLDVRTLRTIAGWLMLAMVAAPASVFADGQTGTTLHVFKNPQCGCCDKWVDHMKNHGYPTDTSNQMDMSRIKEIFGIPAEMQSCHTAVWGDRYVFEGHIPAFLVERFLAAPPQGARGLIVPAMPLGSPGMEMGDRFEPYDVFLLNEDGSTSFYARVEDRKQQYE